MTVKLVELPYYRDSSTVFANIADEPWSIYLDSGYPLKDSGRYDIFSARPRSTFLSYGTETLIEQAGERQKTTADPFMLVRDALGKKQEKHSALPFIGGALGYFAYDLARVLEQLPEHSTQDISMPDMAIGLYDWAVVVDHQLRQSWLVTNTKHTIDSATWAELRDLFQKPLVKHHEPFMAHSATHSNFDKAAYTDAFNKIKQYIIEGDCYQVNLAQRFDVEVSGSAWLAYKLLRELNPAQFAAYMKLADCSILCSSPERFLKVNAGAVETKPIKGTRRRSVFAYEDTALAQELLESEKDRAENLMIVDLLRNDLGKTCTTGSISVPHLYALESYATVHHLVSTVVGRLDEQTHSLDLLRGCFPGGSITGAPKLRSMEIIEELEPHRRNVYCGSIGYIGYDGNMDTNIAIRTLVHQQDKLYCWAGGGIVHDSKVQSEYQESFDKAEAMLKLFSIKDSS